MPLLDAVGINCKKGATTEIKDDYVSVTGLDMTTSPWWREKVMVYYIIIIILIR